jgi:hypothetical protein
MEGDHKTIEVQFESGEIELEEKRIKFEWAFQQVNDNRRIIFHFFLGKKAKDIDFTMAMVSAAQEIPNITFEIFYTEEFDGHDLILNNINPFAKTAIKNTVVKYLKKALTDKSKKSTIPS